MWWTGGGRNGLKTSPSRSLAELPADIVHDFRHGRPDRGKRAPNTPATRVARGYALGAFLHPSSVRWLVMVSSTASHGVGTTHGPAVRHGVAAAQTTAAPRAAGSRDLNGLMATLDGPDGLPTSET
jgi:hypothetical protein